MMSRSFTKKEKILILVLAVLLLGLLYYKLVILDTDEMIKQYDTADLETQVLMEQTKLTSKNQMLAEIEDGSQKANGIVPSYNNIKFVIRAMNDIFSQASDYNITFGQAVQTDETVRRDISVSFVAGSYSRAKSIIKDLKDCQYRCLIKDMEIVSQSEGGKGIRSGAVNVGLTVTFYETMYNADTTLGLQESKVI